MLQKKAGSLLLFIHVKNQYVLMPFFLSYGCYSKSSGLAMILELFFLFFYFCIISNEAALQALNGCAVGAVQEGNQENRIKIITFIHVMP